MLGVSLATWYMPPKFLRAADSGNFRILIANLNTQNKQYEAVLQFTRQTNPDLALFMEVDDAWVQQLNTLSDTLPYSSGEANPYNSGIVVYSHSALANPQIVTFGEGSTPRITGNVTVHNQTLEFVGTHPWPSVRSEPFHSRNRQLDQLGQYVNTVAAPKILMGDLNLSMWSPYYQHLIRNTQLKNARKGFGILPSWPTPGSYHFLPYWALLLFSIPIDHCLLSPDIPVVDVHTGPSLGSDHHPVVVDLQL